MSLEVYHITRKESIQSIVDWWLKTLKQLWEEWIIDLQEKLRRNYSKSIYPQDLINFLVNTLYFRLDEPPLYANWISFIINENEVDVLNNNMEHLGYNEYMKSKMWLLDFLKRSNWEHNLHPITAFPIRDIDIIPEYLLDKLIRIEPTYCWYSPEVFIQRSSFKDIVRVNLWK